MKFEKKVEQLRIQKYGGIETKEFLEDVVVMAQGEPLEYILGEVLFCGAVIDLSLRPMIPRPETEYWVTMCILECKKIIEQNSIKVFKGLDIFSGSGNVGIAILKNIDNSMVDMIEINSTLKKQIEISLIKNKISSTRGRVIIGDLWGELDSHNNQYDLITAVPPYVPSSMKDEVMDELHSEPEIAFFDKEDGYFYHKKIIQESKNFLKSGGVLYLEFDISQRQTIEDLILDQKYSSYSFLTDPYHHEFVVIAVK